jgi:aspartate racemase
LENLGIIGTGKNAATWYFKKCQAIIQLKYGKNAAAAAVKLVIIPFEPINAILPDQMEEAGRLLLPYLQQMDDSGVARFILANITLHEAIDLQNQKVYFKNPFISLRMVVNKHWNTEIKKVMILGTYYTMQSEYIPSLFNNFEIEFVHPNKKDFIAIDELRKTYYKTASPKLANKVFEQLKINNPEIECYIIACTEHALALEDYVGSFVCFNLPELQCLELVQNSVE